MPLALAVVLAVVALFGMRVVELAEWHARRCPPVVGWLAPGEATPLDGRELLDRVARESVVLLGERHDDAAHHRWQLATLKALHRRRPALVLGLEMFPRRVQGVLDAWVAGALDESEFLTAAEWEEVWGADPALYLDIFRYARDAGIPMRALNVEASLTRAVRREGLDAVPPAAREGVTRPAAPSPAYSAWLATIFRHHGAHAAAMQEPGVLRRYIEAQLVWDRAMAQGIRDALAERPHALVVALMGSGHLRHGFGVPHQLADLGVHSRATLLPWDNRYDCRQLVAGLADAVYGLDARPVRKPARAI